MFVDERDGRVDRVDDFDGDFERAIFVGQRRLGRLGIRQTSREVGLLVPATHRREERGSRPHGDAGVPQRGHDGAPCRRRDDIAVQQDRFARVARGGVVGLGVDDDGGGFRGIGRRVDVDVADAVGVAQDRDLGRPLNAAHEGVRASRDDEVDELGRPRVAQDRRDVLAALDERDGVRQLLSSREGTRVVVSWGGGGGVEGVGDDAAQARARPARLFAALEDEPAARSEREAGDLRQRVGPRLEDDEHDAERGRPLLEDEALRELAAERDAAQRVGHRRERARPRRQRRELLLRETEPLPQRRRHLAVFAPRRGLDVFRVGREDLIRVRFQRVGDGAEERRAPLARQGP
mmetsp:Transcript_2547/g.9779  ORF Transcript_2547/g.9779 Transcript_2547/m.9779 type:complete len:349 (+) Transcript_2547:1992-3038(+)